MFWGQYTLHLYIYIHIYIYTVLKTFMISLFSAWTKRSCLGSSPKQSIMGFSLHISGWFISSMNCSFETAPLSLFKSNYDYEPVVGYSNSISTKWYRKKCSTLGILSWVALPTTISPVWVSGVDVPRTPVIRSALGGQMASHKASMCAMRDKIQKKIDTGDVSWLHFTCVVKAWYDLIITKLMHVSDSQKEKCMLNTVLAFYSEWSWLSLFWETYCILLPCVCVCMCTNRFTPQQVCKCRPWEL